MKKLLTFLVLLLTLHTAPAWATTYYVHATSGSDGNNCSTAQSSTASNAKATIADLLNDGCIASGDTIRLHGSGGAGIIYSEAGFSTDDAGRDIPNGTSWANATIIENYNGTVTWRYTGKKAIRFRNSDSYIIIRSAPGAPHTFIIDGVNGEANTGGSTGAFNFRLDGSGTHHIKFENLEMKNATLSNIYSDLNTHDMWITGNYIHHNGTNTLDHGVYMEGDTAIIEYNRLENNTGTGTQMYNGFSGGSSDNNIFRYNFVKDNMGSGLVIDGVNNTIDRNIFIGNGTTSAFASGISCGYAPGSSGNKIYNNTIHAQDGYGITLGQTGNCQNVDLKNNSISANTQQCILKGSGTVSGAADETNCNGNGNNTISAGSATVTNTSTSRPTTSTSTPVP